MANKLIQLKDHLGNLLYPKIKRDIITGRNSVYQRITTSASWISTKINMDTANSLGNKLILDSTNKKIIIGSGVTKVSISASVYVGSGISTMFGVEIKKNGSVLLNSFASAGGTWGATATIIPQLINVAAGDYFELFCYFDQAQSNKDISAGGAVLTIEVKE